MNAIAERFVGSVKRERLSKFILFGEAHLRRALAEFLAHYNAERPHQGIGNERMQPPTEPPLVETGEVVADERLGGLLRRPVQKLGRTKNKGLTSTLGHGQHPGPMPDHTPLRFLLATFAGWVNRLQAQENDYLIEENRVLRELLGQGTPAAE